MLALRASQHLPRARLAKALIQTMNSSKNTISTRQKALEINLDDGKYGTIVEIGAGQEVARQFFSAGAAAGTIAKTMSAYDMQITHTLVVNDLSKCCTANLIYCSSV